MYHLTHEEIKHWEVCAFVIKFTMDDGKYIAAGRTEDVQEELKKYPFIAEAHTIAPYNIWFVTTGYHDHTMDWNELVKYVFGVLHNKKYHPRSKQ